MAISAIYCVKHKTVAVVTSYQMWFILTLMDVKNIGATTAVFDLFEKWEQVSYQITSSYSVYSTKTLISRQYIRNLSLDQQYMQCCLMRPSCSFVSDISNICCTNQCSCILYLRHALVYQIHMLNYIVKWVYIHLMTICGLQDQ